MTPVVADVADEADHVRVGTSSFFLHLNSSMQKDSENGPSSAGKMTSPVYVHRACFESGIPLSNYLLGCVSIIEISVQGFPNYFTGLRKPVLF